ncbi:2-hydroxyacid dehydrogenase [Streptomyces cocklensis]|jgi:D-lactate dehydrogenase|uniref:D-lactate dehydrogenase n=1 Tax=Actinacidiphila cocklensis TaxID=887465 RepID=A0A9W4E700_9ACTN|nr:2-hydroxyacid dehydrogenase [Actinacidiphila cocklensis]MDD1060233.1 2-hydroxyacid dehydrogenase [Actinacidiphila cocklensis]WSX76663.1 2-hydroxyacid dehydrogenase [Streptomyces sp. NBC_00899]CAG6394281.1 D-lactate dehydrogenase [Actinacidiphila cocklensis]
MDVLATGVQRDERPLLEAAFAGRHDIRCLETTLTADTLPLAAGYEAVSTSVNTVLDAPVLEALVKGGTRLITQRSTGYNNIDLAHAERLGMTVARVAAYSPYAVAEFAWTLALALNRRIVRAAGRTRDFDFRLDGLLGRDFHGRTAGVIGTGRIGTAFTAIARGFGMRLLGWDITPNPECEEMGMQYVELDRLFREADVLTLHVPLMPSTHHLVGSRRLAEMKEDAILINTSRGALIDSAALVETLRDGRLGGVGLDVYEEEAGVFFYDKSLEVMTDDVLARLLTFTNVLVSSHQAYYTVDAVEEIVAATLRNVNDYVAGRITESTLIPRP